MSHPDPRLILAVDDDPAIRALIRTALAAAGHLVEEAANGRLGVEAAFRFLPDLILLDVEMPEMDGREAVALLKQDPRTRDIPVVMLTGLSDSPHAIAGLGAGADEYLAKPMPMRELRARVHAMLRLRALQEELVRLERERHESRLALAREVQQSLLPASLPRLPGLDLAVRYLPCEALGGDFYDALDSPAGPLLVLGDAEGHGPAAALWMATARAYLRAGLADPAASPGRLLASLNRLIARDRSHTALLPLMIFRLEPDRLLYANAGHEGPLVLPPGGAGEFLDSTGPLLGMLEEADFEEVAVEFPSGSVLVAFTDGLTEAVDAGKEAFGRERIRGVVNGARGQAAAAHADRLVEAWRGHCREGAVDDLTVMIVKRE